MGMLQANLRSRALAFTLLALAACTSDADESARKTRPVTEPPATAPRPGAPSEPKPAPAETPPAVPTIGKLAPEIVGEDIDGRPIKLSDYRGKVVMLDFWGNW
jgi:hypothetical protein